MPVTKSEIKDFADKVKEQIVAGYENPLDVSIMLSAMEEAIKQLRKDKDIKELLKDEADKYPEKTFDYNGATISKKMVGVKYHYDKCNDTALQDLMNEKRLLDNNIKARQEWLKGLDKPTADPHSGELINPAIKTGTESVTITLKK